jgi:hypothetical protein
MTRLRTDVEGPGSYDELVEYVVADLRANFTPTSKEETAFKDEYERRATAIVLNILRNLNISTY